MLLYVFRFFFTVFASSPYCFSELFKPVLCFSNAEKTQRCGRVAVLASCHTASLIHSLNSPIAGNEDKAPGNMEVLKYLSLEYLLQHKDDLSTQGRLKLALAYLLRNQEQANPSHTHTQHTHTRHTQELLGKKAFSFPSTCRTGALRSKLDTQHTQHTQNFLSLSTQTLTHTHTVEHWSSWQASVATPLCKLSQRCCATVALWHCGLPSARLGCCVQTALCAVLVRCATFRDVLLLLAQCSVNCSLHLLCKSPKLCWSMCLHRAYFCRAVALGTCYLCIHRQSNVPTVSQHICYY